MKVINFQEIGSHPGRYQLKVEDENTYLVIDLDKIEVLKIAAMLKGKGF